MFIRSFFLLCLIARPLVAFWEPSESLKLKIYRDVQISPDNQHAIVVVADEETNPEQMTTKLYLWQKNAPLREFASHGNPTQPRWSPDGQSIAFLATDNGITNLYVVQASGGEPIALVKNKKSIQTFRWSPDGRSIAFVMQEDLPKVSPSRVALTYKKETCINRLWTVDVSNPQEPQALTTNEYYVRGSADWGTNNAEFDWSPDSKKIIFAYTTGAGLENIFLESSIALLDLDSTTITPWEKTAQHESQPIFSPDGETVAYLASETESSYACNRYVNLRCPDGSYQRKLAPTFNEGPLMAGANLLGWSADEKHLVYLEPYQTKYRLYLVPTDGTAPKAIKSQEWFFKVPAHALSPDRTRIGLIGQSSSKAPEAYITKLDKFKPQQLTHFNDFFKDHPMGKTEIISWKSNDGQVIQGLLTYPQDYQEGKQYPLIVNIHGGPMFFFDESYNLSQLYPIAAFSEAGIMTLRPNPRGSTGYGKAFREANYGDWGGKDFEDIMSGVDHVINQGLADPNKLGIMGWSYGGYMTAWAVTQTNRFKAASIGAPCINLTSFSGTSDLNQLVSDYMGDFFTNADLYRARSPLTFANKVTTPCLIQHGLNDCRVPVSQSYELYHALNLKKKIATLELYPNMQHGPVTPKDFLDIMERNLSWFKEHLLDQKSHDQAIMGGRSA